jgi:hypothetical protein
MYQQRRVVDSEDQAVRDRAEFAASCSAAAAAVGTSVSNSAT